ncbi:MAG: hypothetical protein ACYSUK_12935 [Planctomycetota bacterium]
MAQDQATAALIRNIAEQQTAVQQRKVIEELTQDFTDTVTIASDAETGLGKAIDNTSRAASGPLGLLVQAFTGVETSVTGVSTAINQMEIESRKIQLEKIESGEFTDGLQEDLGTLSDFFRDQDNLAKKAAELRQADALAKDRETARKRAQEAAKRETERLIRERERILKAEVKTAEAQISLIKRLEETIIKAQLDAQADGLEKSLQQEEQATSKRVENLESQQSKFVEEAQQRQAKINAAFGEGSEEAIRLQGQISAQRIAITENTDTAIEAEREASLKRIEDIEKNFADKQAQEAQQQLQKRLGELQTKGNIDAIQADNQAFNARKANILDQIEVLENQEDAIISLGLEIDSEAFRGVVSQRQQLNTQLAELEEAQTKKVEQETQKQSAARQKSFEKASEAFLNTVNIVSQIGEIVSQANQRQLQEEADERAANIENLQSELNEASGLERAFLEQRIAQEAQAAEEIAQRQIRAEKEAAIAGKAVAITEATINTFLGVTNALASLPPPLSFITAGVTAALGAVQIAGIAAQPLATGGIVGFNNGGKVNQGQNIATQPNGDNVLATLKRGEVVLNKRQQGLLGGSSTFRAAGVPGFQGGGVVSPPIGAPSLAQSVSDNNNVQALIETNSRLIASVNSRIDRISVEYTTETGDAIERDNKDRKEITTRATL